MHSHQLVTLVTLALLSMTACGGDERSGDDPEATPWTMSTPTPAPLSHSWRSAGDDIAPIMREGSNPYAEVQIEFEDDRNYTFTATRADGTSDQTIGSYITEKSDLPPIMKIMLFQAKPIEAGFRGIFEINADQDPAIMRYEVVQTEPYAGYTEPQAEAGFGSTNNGELGQDWVYWFTGL